MASRPRRSRSARALEEAPSSSCPHCGRETKTVQGVCADCWGAKDPDAAMDRRQPPRTEPLFGFGSDLDDLFGLDPLLVIAALVVGAALVVALVFGLR